MPTNLKVDQATKISDNLREKLIKEIKNLSYIAIQIKSHDIETGFYKIVFGRGYGWQRRGRFKGKVQKSLGRGPGGFCVCSKCGYKIPHQVGIPCSTISCPNCKINLKRQ